MLYIVTGAGGFIGSHLVQRILAQCSNVHVMAICHYRSDGSVGCMEEVPRSSRITVLRGDVTDSRWLTWAQREHFDLFSVARKTVVFNCAANVSVPYGELMSHEYIRTNTLGPVTLMETLDHDMFVQVSTSEVFSGRHGLYAPDAQLSPTTIYGATKAAAELLVHAWPRDTRVIRLFNVFGPRQHPRAVVAKMCRLLAQHHLGRAADFEFGDPSAVRVFNPVTLAATAILKLVEEPVVPTGQTQQFCADSTCEFSIQQMFERAAEVAASMFQSGRPLPDIHWDSNEHAREPGRDVPCLRGEYSPMFADVLYNTKEEFDHELRATLQYWAQRPDNISRYHGGNYQ